MELATGIPIASNEMVVGGPLWLQNLPIFFLVPVAG